LDLLNAQLTSLADQINELFDRFNNVSLGQSTFLTELDQCCADAHRTIDLFYERKKKEFDKLVNEERNKCKAELDQLRDKVKQLIQAQEATHEHIDYRTISLRLSDDGTTHQTDYFLPYGFRLRQFFNLRSISLCHLRSEQAMDK